MNYNAYAFSKRNRILKASNFTNYQDFLKSDIWAATREKFLKKNKTKPHWQKCHGCGTDKSLQLHHMRYKKINLTRISLNNIIPLCGYCHGLLHEISRRDNSSFKVALRTLKKELAISVDNLT